MSGDASPTAKVRADGTPSKRRRSTGTGSAGSGASSSGTDSSPSKRLRTRYADLSATAADSFEKKERDTDSELDETYRGKNLDEFENDDWFVNDLDDEEDGHEEEEEEEVEEGKGNAEMVGAAWVGTRARYLLPHVLCGLFIA